MKKLLFCLLTLLSISFISSAAAEEEKTAVYNNYYSDPYGSYNGSYSPTTIPDSYYIAPYGPIIAPGYCGYGSYYSPYWHHDGYGHHSYNHHYNGHHPHSNHHK